MKLKYILIMILILSGIINTNFGEIPVIVNSNTPDNKYYDLLPENNLNSLNTKKYIKELTIKNYGSYVLINGYIQQTIPTYNSFRIYYNENKYMDIEYTVENNVIKYKKVMLSEKIDFCNKNNFEVFGKLYNISSITDDEIKLIGNKNKISESPNFTYLGVDFNVKYIQPMTGALVLDITDNNGNTSEVTLCGCEGCVYKFPCGALYYEKEESNPDKGKFVFYGIDEINLIDGQKINSCGNKTDYVFHMEKDNSCSTPCCTISCPTKKIISYEYAYPEKLSKSFNLFGTTIQYIKTDKEGVSYFNIIQNISDNIEYETVKKDNFYKLPYDENTILLPQNNVINIYHKNIKKESNFKILESKNGIEIKKVYSTYKKEENINLSNVSSNIILIGGPKSNKLTKKIMPYLIKNISNENPGRNKGYIQKIKNPFNKKYNITVLAGSDRYGTKAAVLVYSKNPNKNWNISLVELKNNNVNILWNN